MSLCAAFLWSFRQEKNLQQQQPTKKRQVCDILFNFNSIKSQHHIGRALNHAIQWHIFTQ